MTCGAFNEITVKTSFIGKLEFAVEEVSQWNNVSKLVLSNELRGTFMIISLLMNKQCVKNKKYMWVTWKGKRGREKVFNEDVISWGVRKSRGEIDISLLVCVWEFTSV